VNSTGIRNSLQVKLLSKLGLPSAATGNRSQDIARYYNVIPLCLNDRETDPDLAQRPFWLYGEIELQLPNCPLCTNTYFDQGAGSSWDGPWYNPPVTGNRPASIVNKHPQSQGFGYLFELQDWCITPLLCPLFFEHRVCTITHSFHSNTYQPEGSITDNKQRCGLRCSAANWGTRM